MIESYNALPPMYMARLSGGELVILEISPHCYMRTGTAGMSKTKLGAIEVLKKGVMTKFQDDITLINWQSQQYIPNLSIKGE